MTLLATGLLTPRPSGHLAASVAPERHFQIRRVLRKEVSAGSRRGQVITPLGQRRRTTKAKLVSASAKNLTASRGVAGAWLKVSMQGL
jgi:hypothetical protein